MKQRWAHLWNPQTRADEAAFLHSAFSLRLDVMPSKLWGHPEISRLPKPSTEDTSATHQAVQAAWRLQALATMHAIWRWRMEADEPTDIWSATQAKAYHDSCLRATLADLRWARAPDSNASCHTAAAIELLKSSDPEGDPETASECDATDTKYVLSSMAGPGGSGAVIIRTNLLSTRASIIWSAAMSKANPTTTNNQAEYGGAIAGLRAAHEHQWLPLEVVGDSQLILHQLQRYRAPRNERLRPLYAEARRLGDQLGVRKWIHHLRAHNKMADGAANIAMDDGASSQVHHPTNRARHAALAQHLGTDFAQWQAQHFARLVVQ